MPRCSAEPKDTAPFGPAYEQWRSSRPDVPFTIGNYWPYATTLFDYTRRAMPLTNPQSLTNDEAYAVTAYVLYLNGIVAESDEMNARSLPQVRMPNRDGFVDWSRRH